MGETLIFEINETAEEGSKPGLTVACFFCGDYCSETFLGVERMERAGHVGLTAAPG